MRIGLIGTGRISGAYGNAVKAHPDRFKLTAVCHHSDKAKAIVAEFNLDCYWRDYRKFVDEAPVDAVVVCLPHVLHYDAVKVALQAGKHVLVEKPFVDCVETGLEPITSAREDIGTMAAVFAVYESVQRGGAKVPVRGMYA